MTNWLTLFTGYQSIQADIEAVAGRPVANLSLFSLAPSRDRQARGPPAAVIARSRSGPIGMRPHRRGPRRSAPADRTATLRGRPAPRAAAAAASAAGAHSRRAPAVAPEPGPECPPLRPAAALEACQWG